MRHAHHFADLQDFDAENKSTDRDEQSYGNKEAFAPRLLPRR
jgi:hypothetical protein